MDDQELVKNCQNNNLDSFADLYDKYIEKIYNFVYFRIQQKEVAEDLTSKIFLKALEGINGYSLKKGNFSSWLYRIAKNTIIDYYRVDKKELNIEDIWGLGEESEIAKDLDIASQINKVKNYLKELKPAQRDIIVMRLWDQLSYSEISDILGKSESSCKMMYSRSISKLRSEVVLSLLLLILTIKS